MNNNRIIKMSKKADLKIKMKLYKLMWEQACSNIFSMFHLKIYLPVFVVGIFLFGAVNMITPQGKVNTISFSQQQTQNLRSLSEKRLLQKKMNYYSKEALIRSAKLSSKT